MTFLEDIQALLGLYNNNIKKIKEESTLMIFDFILKKPNNQDMKTIINSIRIGKFYMIQYDYNGNKLWCPILTIPPVPNKNETGFLDKIIKISTNKKILYAVNFDYLPLKYKAFLIDSIIKNNISKYEKNSDLIFKGNVVVQENNFIVNWIYNFLKNNGNKNYAITAFDISKIKNVFEISSTILNRFIFVDTYYINKRLMYDVLEGIQNVKLKSDFSNKIKKYEDILKLYENDVEEFYKTLRNFEKDLKLLD